MSQSQSLAEFVQNLRQFSLNILHQSTRRWLIWSEIPKVWVNAFYFSTFRNLETRRVQSRYENGEN